MKSDDGQMAGCDGASFVGHGPWSCRWHARQPEGRFYLRRPCRRLRLELSPFGPAVSDSAKKLIEQRRQEMSAEHFDVFWGPIKAQTGNVRIAAGGKPADDVLLRMDWFVEGVVGTVLK
jgi:hypothetical protein